MASVAVRRTSDLTEIELILLWALVREAFDGDLSQEDWTNARGGLHVVLSEGDQLISHAAVVPRTMVAGGRPLSVGYVEAVATRPRWQKQGHGTTVMRAVATIVSSDFELGALSTGDHSFYSDLGWEPWRGPTYAQSPTGRVRTSADDGSVMIMRTVRTYDLETHTPLVCEWRPGEVW
ncbi:MAG: GNAT family N-acetyltransferase [Acidimicrobiales bacterium]